MVMSAQADNLINLPTPRTTGTQGIESLLEHRRSIREYRDAAVSLEELAQLLWSAQGITDARGHRTAPSAGALYPLELYVVVGKVKGLPAGIYHYQAKGHRLQSTGSHDVRQALAQAALSQEWLADAPVVLVFTAVPERTTEKYGERGIHYIYMEVGHAAQNVFLQAGALGLGTVVVGAFEDKAVARVVGLPPGRKPMILMPVGKM